MQFAIEALRNDGMTCGATVDVESYEEAMRECRKIFRTFRAGRNGIICNVPVHKSTYRRACFGHYGQIFTFSMHTAKLHEIQSIQVKTSTAADAITIRQGLF